MTQFKCPRCKQLHSFVPKLNKKFEDVWSSVKYYCEACFGEWKYLHTNAMANLAYKQRQRERKNKREKLS